MSYPRPAIRLDTSDEEPGRPLNSEPLAEPLPDLDALAHARVFQTTLKGRRVEADVRCRAPHQVPVIRFQSQKQLIVQGPELSFPARAFPGNSQFRRPGMAIQWKVDEDVPDLARMHVFVGDRRHGRSGVAAAIRALEIRELDDHDTGGRIALSWKLLQIEFRKDLSRVLGCGCFAMRHINSEHPGGQQHAPFYSLKDLHERRTPTLA